MVDLVNENEEILNKMKGNLRQTFVAAMAKVSWSRYLLPGGPKIYLFAFFAFLTLLNRY